MYWYNKLYLGDNVKDETELVKKLKNRQPVLSAYLLVLTRERGKLIDIVHNIALLQGLYTVQEADDILIIGVALGKRDALRLVRDIIDEVYTKTGEVNLHSYFCFAAYNTI